MNKNIKLMQNKKIKELNNFYLKNLIILAYLYKFY